MALNYDEVMAEVETDLPFSYTDKELVLPALHRVVNHVRNHGVELCCIWTAGAVQALQAAMSVCQARVEQRYCDRRSYPGMHGDLEGCGRVTHGTRLAR